LSRIGPTDIELGNSYRARVIWNGKELFNGEKLSIVLKALKIIDVDQNYLSKMPAVANFTLAKEAKDQIDSALNEIIKNLDLVLKIVKSEKARKLMFIALYSDEAGNFWFKPTISFTEAVNQNLASIELNIDFVKEYHVSQEVKEKIGAIYRMLNSFFAPE
jgi:predicted CoA-binding protein